MPAGTVLSTRLITLQSFKEVTWGTGAAATAKWMGVQPLPTFTPMYKATVFDEQRGAPTPGYVSAVLMNGGKFSIKSYATYEDMIYYLAGAVQGGITPTGTTDKTWAFVAPVTPNTPWNTQSYTLEFGYDIGTIVANGCTVEKLTFAGEASKENTVELAGFYKTHNQNGTLTPALTDRTVEVAIGPTTKCYIDAVGATIGTTEMANALGSWSVEISTGLAPVYTAGSLGPTGFSYSKYDVSMTLQLLYTSVVKTALTTYFATGLPALIRVASTSGTKVIQFDMCGVLTDDFNVYGDREGAQVVELKLGAKYDSTFANFLKATVTNQVATIP